MESIAEILDKAQVYEQELPPKPALPPAPLGIQIAGWIDSTLVTADASADQIKKLCEEARAYNFASVIVNPAYVPLASGLLSNTQILVGSVVGFPLGATLPTQKLFEALSNITAGASEIDMVINIGALKSKAYGLVLNDVQSVVQTAHAQNVNLKVILETPILTHKEKIIACLLCKAAGADFVKTSTGYVSGGATVEDIDLMFRLASPEMEVKAAVGIRDYNTALAMIKAGATRLGSSTAVKIIQEASVLVSQEL
jgi:deoxyribose-phosphate aldolase